MAHLKTYHLTRHIIDITKDFKDFNPNYSYAVVDVNKWCRSLLILLVPYGYMPNGQTSANYIKPANLSRAYIVGNYVISGIIVTFDL